MQPAPKEHTGMNDPWYCVNCDFIFDGVETITGMQDVDGTAKPFTIRRAGHCFGCGRGIDDPRTVPMYEVIAATVDTVVEELRGRR